MNACEIVRALEALDPPASLEAYPSYAARRDELIAAMQCAIDGGETLTAEHRKGLEAAVAHAEMAMHILEARRDEVLTQRERARLARRRVAQHLRDNPRGRIDLSA